MKSEKKPCTSISANKRRKSETSHNKKALKKNEEEKG